MHRGRHQLDHGSSGALNRPTLLVDRILDLGLNGSLARLVKRVVAEGGALGHLRLLAVVILVLAQVVPDVGHGCVALVDHVRRDDERVVPGFLVVQTVR